MKTHKSKKYLIQIYVALVVFILSLAVLVFFLIKYPPHAVSNIILLWGMVALIGVVILFIIRNKVRIPEVTVSRSGIDICAGGGQQKRIRWSEISDIDYYSGGKTSNREFINIKTKASSKPIVINYNFYSNANEIVQAIQACRTAVINGETPTLKGFSEIKIQEVSPDELSSEKFEYVSRWPLFTLYTYLALYIIGGAIYAGYSQIPVKGTNQIVALIVLLVFSGLGIILGTLFMSKVGLSNRYLVIKNFYFPYRRVFRLEDITEVILERPNKNTSQTFGMKGIRVITKDGNRKIHTIMNFLDRDWNKLQKMLQDKKIPVQNYSRFNSRLLR